MQLTEADSLIEGMRQGVTEAGSPAAHLFDAARALGIPAVCGIRLRTSSNRIIAVDGHAGVVAILPLEGETDD